MEKERLTPFWRVGIGQKFKASGIQVRTGLRFIRLVTCVKVAPMTLRYGHIGNAVVLLDHVGKPSLDMGGILFFDRADTVEIVNLKS